MNTGRAWFATVCVVGVASVLSPGCGPKSNQTEVTVAEDFECRERRAGYVVVGAFGAARKGVEVSCASGTPTVTRVRQETEDAELAKRSAALGSRDFDELWERIDSTGWRNMEDCDQFGEDGDPAYTIVVSDAERSVTMKCEGRTLPFPYDQLVNELDLKAGAVPESL